MSTPREKAVAIRYEEGAPAPWIVAKGKGRLAERMKQIARDEGIPLREEDLLTEALFELDLDAWIPEEFFAIMAEILAFAYALRDKDS